MKKYTAFYTYPSFKITDKVQCGQFVEIEKDAKALKQIVYDRDHKKNWSIRISADGLFQFRDDKIEHEIEEIEASWEKDLATAKSFDGPWMKYLDICNVINFCFECSIHSNGLNMYGFNDKKDQKGDRFIILLRFETKVSKCTLCHDQLE